ncbi:YitT family protein [Paracoccus aestuariivivens]|uniref:YitT family protein n=1 Tax=Paracoccus aestuariivivens TaxID=1820333 RepID=A0A6L6J9W3_9RHOB|nr:YitT family protein [Paracoccus aestuariivivens]MTH77529.1 YitT family protein [Paracoccus aestuariivivens]
MTKSTAKHSMIDDAQGLAYGSFIASVGVVLMTHMGFVTGQTAGLAILISYATGWGFGPVFFVVNLPFYWLGCKRFGLAFTLKSFVAVAMLSVLAQFLPQHLQFGHVHPAVAAILLGCLTGSALLALFRHGASLGGIGIVGLYIQDATGFRAGWTQLIFDACLFACALLVRDVRTVALSFLGALVLNLVIALNHRRDRYIVG